jgi:glycosyltransferase involved in cell wall biosynthesis
MPEFSIIVPVYNVENFLAECLDSCIGQTFKDIEIICINDCSQDGSRKILEAYSLKDTRIRIITHKQNRGLGGARNTGIENATGDYCWFVDSDDSIALDACEILHQTIKNTNADIVRFNSITYKYDVTNGEKSYNNSKRIPNAWSYDKLHLEKDYKNLGLSGTTAWSYISRTSLLKTVKFRENCIHEDVDFTPFFLSRAKSIYCINYFLYFYRQRLGSLNTDGENGMHIANHILAISSLYDNIRKYNIKSNHFCYRYFLDGVRGLKKDYNKHPEIHCDEYDTIIKKLYKFDIILRQQIFYLNLRIARRIKRFLLYFIENVLK